MYICIDQMLFVATTAVKPAVIVFDPFIFF